MTYLLEKLEEYEKSDFYAFHMPGHKRNCSVTGSALPYGIDITEIEGFDDLHHAKDLLKEAEERAASVFCSDECHYLINGSTAGILSAVLGSTKKGGKILMGRNCHKSVYNAVFLNELQPIYIYPGFCGNTELNGPICSEQIREALREHADIQAVVITSPTYDGVVSDIEQIATAVHEMNIPLIVDEAHGAHFGFDSYFPENANKKGADVVIHSLHKTLPSLTQTALIHINGSLADRRKIRRYLHILQTSSPSYVLMASIDECVKTLAQRKAEVFTPYVKMLEETREALTLLKNMSLIETEKYDRSKIVISVKDTIRQVKDNVDGIQGMKTIPFTGKDLYNLLLEKYHLQMEMAAGSYIVAMTGPGDTRKGLRRLISALQEIDRELWKMDSSGEYIVDKEISEKSYVSGAGKIETEKKTVFLTWDEAAGKTAREYAYLYPPGIPLTVPGEKIGRDMVRKIRDHEKMGFTIEGTEYEGKIEVEVDE